MITIRNMKLSTTMFGMGVLTVLLVGAGLLISAFTSEAQSSPTLGKGDRLDIQSRAGNCSKQAWPYYEASCLRSSISNMPATVRMIPTGR